MKNISQLAFILAIGVIVGAVTIATPVPANAASGSKGQQGGPRTMEDASCPLPSPSPSPGG